MRPLDQRINALALDAERIVNDVDFRAGLTECRGELTMTHVCLESARQSIARAKEIIDRAADEAERFRLEADALHTNEDRSAA